MTAEEAYKGFGRGAPLHPGRGGFKITPSDSDELTTVTRAIYCGSAGNIAFKYVDGDTDIWQGLAAGQMYPIMARQVYSTGTTSTDLHGVK